MSSTMATDMFIEVGVIVKVRREKSTAHNNSPDEAHGMMRKGIRGQWAGGPARRVGVPPLSEEWPRRGGGLGSG